MLGELDVAEKGFLHAPADSEQFVPYDAIGLYYLEARQGKVDDGVKTLAAATQKHPGFISGLNYLGSAYERMGKAKAAVDVFKSYRERLLKSPWARILHARALAYGGQLGEAIAETRKVVSDFPDSISAVASLAGRLEQAKKYDEARNVDQGSRGPSRRSGVANPAFVYRAADCLRREGVGPGLSRDRKTGRQPRRDTSRLCLRQSGPRPGLVVQKGGGTRGIQESRGSRR
jgi:tetratricopeptide (TPR) repeat protein